MVIIMSPIFLVGVGGGYCVPLPLLLNLALLVAKFYIYRCSLDEAPVFFRVFETELRGKAGIEYDIKIGSF